MSSGGDHHTDELLKNGILDSLEYILEKPEHHSLHKNACWTFSNITTGSTEQLEIVMKSNMIKIVSNVAMQSKDDDVKTEAIWSLCNITSCANEEQIANLVESGFFKLFDIAHLLFDEKIVQVVLEALDNIVEVAKGSKKIHPIVKEHVEKCDVQKIVQKWCEGKSEDIVSKAYDMKEALLSF